MCAFTAGSLASPNAARYPPSGTALAPLPWRARLAATWEPDRSKAFQISQDYGGLGRCRWRDLFGRPGRPPRTIEQAGK
jgi:hypothetical protein